MTDKMINREEAISEIQNSLADEEAFLSNLKIGIQKKSDEKIIKKDSELDGIEEYLYIAKRFGDDELASAKLKEYAEYPFELNEMWQRAEKNTFYETTIKSMFEVLVGICGAPEEIVPDAPLYILSNLSGIRGASAILDQNALKEFGDKFGVKKIFAIPSSIHECATRFAA